MKKRKIRKIIRQYLKQHPQDGIPGPAGPMGTMGPAGIGVAELIRETGSGQAITHWRDTNGNLHEISRVNMLGTGEAK